MRVALKEPCREVHYARFMYKIGSEYDSSP
jgi:hypothetical protein